MQRRDWRAVAALTAAFTLAFTVAASPPAGGRSVQAAAAPLYRCTDATRVEAGPVGLTLCDAEPTGELVDRAERDHLQVRSGALVVTVAPGGVAAREGLVPNDMIFRVAGSDVDGGGPAGARLSDVGAASDTLVNFLRAGRPYRVKLRR